MKRNIILLILVMALLFIAGKSSAGQPPYVPTQQKWVFWIEGYCADSTKTIYELRGECEDLVSTVPDLVGTPPLLTICPPGEPNPRGPTRYLPEGYQCGNLACEEGYIEVNCSVRQYED